MTIDLITIKELLRDPVYREYFKQVPKLPEHITPANRPWKLIVMKKGESVWRTKRFGTYREAFEGLKKMLPNIDNGAINCPAFTFMPPIRTVRVKGKTVTVRGREKPLIISRVWVPRLSGDIAPHNWCPHCRRPTIFKYAAVNTNRKDSKYSMPVGEPQLRCTICGASERVVDLRRPERHQQWDTDRPIFHTMQGK